MLPPRALSVQGPPPICSCSQGVCRLPLRMALPPSPPLKILQGDVKEGMGAAQAKAEDVAGDASRAAQDAGDKLKP